MWRDSNAFAALLAEPEVLTLPELLALVEAMRVGIRR
jgi:hypothetical protein